MAKRTLSVIFVSVLLLLLAMPAADAAPSTTGAENAAATALGNDSSHGELRRAAVHSQIGPSQNGWSHALANSERGMNRRGSPGTWNENGHVPAEVSFPQGHSPSDPDANGNGGVDKPGFTGGFDADRDGNNGCGNDSDREDDNNGWCGKPHVSTPPQTPPEQPPGPNIPPGTKPVVLGKKVTTNPVTLPRTGVDVSQVMWIGWGLVLAGTSLKRAARGSRR
ncbi:MAG: hypothetical protein ABR548_05755 [Actinomycetota bacterium]|nr:hypothetical protein [Actinomycetota bacterium]